MGQVWKPGPAYPATAAALPPAWLFRIRIFCNNEGDALGFRMAPRWGLGHCAASELGKGVIGVAGLEFKGERPCDEPRLPSPLGV